MGLLSCELILPRKTHLGGYGTGQHTQPKNDGDSENARCVPYHFDNDKVLVEFEDGTLDKKATGFSCLTFYRMLRKLETAGCVIKSVSFLKVTRWKLNCSKRFFNT